jgi:hypothetical protein
MRRLLAAIGVVAGAAGLTAFLLSASRGMRDVMVTDGGFCASGGPYVIARQCSGGDMRLLLVGILAGLACAGAYLIGTAGLGQSAAAAGLLAWTAPFGVLGWNFISLGLRPGAGRAASSGWLVTGGVFWAMALGGLVLALVTLAGTLRAAGRLSPAMSGPQPLVRAVIPPGLASSGWQPNDIGGWRGSVGGMAGAGGVGGLQASPGRAAAIMSAFAWLVASLAGVAVGIAVSSSLIAALK